jgi:hypothetical protein
VDNVEQQLRQLVAEAPRLFAQLGKLRVTSLASGVPLLKSKPPDAVCSESFAQSVKQLGGLIVNQEGGAFNCDRLKDRVHLGMILPVLQGKQAKSIHHFSERHDPFQDGSQVSVDSVDTPVTNGPLVCQSVAQQLMFVVEAAQLGLVGSVSVAEGALVLAISSTGEPLRCSLNC